MADAARKISFGKKRPIADVQAVLHKEFMKELKDIRILWAVGALMLISCSVGVFLIGSAIALPLVFGATALGHPVDVAIKWLIFISPLWLPIGVGMGIGVVAKPVRWLRKKDGPEAVET